MDVFRDIFKDSNNRFKSPFYLSFIIAWITWNWRIIWYLFSVPDDISWAGREHGLSALIKSSGWCGLLWCPLGYAFLGMLLFYVMRYVGYGIHRAGERWVRTFIEKKVRMNLVPEEIHNAAINEIEALKQQLKEEANGAVQYNDLERRSQQLRNFINSTEYKLRRMRLTEDEITLETNVDDDTLMYKGKKLILSGTPIKLQTLSTECYMAEDANKNVYRFYITELSHGRHSVLVKTADKLNHHMMVSTDYDSYTLKDIDDTKPNE